MSLPIYRERVIEDENMDPCGDCPMQFSWDMSLKCRQVPIVRYDREDQLAAVDETAELLVVSDPPTEKDESRGGYFSDPDGLKILDAIKESGPKSFVVVPAVRCYPGEQIDHFILDKKYRNKRRNEEERGIDTAKEALKHCKDYIVRARATFRPRRTLVLGPIAAKGALDDGNVKKLRSNPIHPNPGLAAASKKEGVIVTWDRAYVAIDQWAATDMLRDLEERLPNLAKTGYATQWGDHKTIKQHTLTTVSSVRKFVDWCLTSKDIKKNDFLCFDFETRGLELSPEKNAILNVGFAFKNSPNTAYVIPLDHPETPFSLEELTEVHGHMKRLFEAKGAPFYAFLAHNAQFETAIVKTFYDVWLGDPGGKVILDSQILAYLQNENRSKTGIRRPYSLETLALEYLGFRWYTDVGIKTRRDRLEEEQLVKVNEYVGYDAVNTARITKLLMRWMKEEGSLRDLMNVAVNLYSEAIKYTVDLKLTGQYVDLDLLMLLRGPNSSIGPRIAEIKRVFAESPLAKKAAKIVAKKNNAKIGMKSRFKTSGSGASSFDLNSPLHRKALFWEVLKLEGADVSVDAKFQAKHADKNELVGLFQEYQGLTKLDSSYLAPISEYLQASGDGRVHPTFHLTRTTSGRLSASDPNTQQTVRDDTRDKKQVKSLYCVPPGKIMVQCDFSQAEVRWLGILSGDENLKKRYAVAKELKVALREDPNNPELQRRVVVEGDLHMSTAIDMYRLPKDLPFTNPKLAKKKRQNAKSVCFGLIYGKHWRSLALDLGIPEEEAQEAVEKWMGQFPWAAAWLENVDNTIGDTCVSISPFGRWRHLPEAAALDVSIRNRAKRQARNTPIQNAASDFCVYGACKIRRTLMNHPNPLVRQTKLINTVHDSLGAELVMDEEAIWTYMNIASDILTDPMLIYDDFGIEATVPLEVDFDIGLNYGNLMKGCEVNREDIKRAMFNTEILRAQPTGTLLEDLEGKGLLYGEA